MLHSKTTLFLKTLLRVLFSNIKDRWFLMYRTRCNKAGILQRPLVTLVYHN